jgi:hypothetical protein
MDKTRINQTQRVLAFLRAYPLISQLQMARQANPILRLGARVYDLRRDGHDIRLTRAVPRKGKPFWAYRLVEP